MLNIFLPRRGDGGIKSRYAPSTPLESPSYQSELGKNVCLKRTAVYHIKNSKIKMICTTSQKKLIYDDMSSYASIFAVWWIKVPIRANYRLVWKKKFSCTTVSPFTFTYNHKISNFPLRKQKIRTCFWKVDTYTCHVILVYWQV